jgi:hypothetical protein
LSLDPQELRNVYGSAENAIVQNELEQALLDWQLRTGDVTPQVSDPRGFPEGLVI